MLMTPPQAPRGTPDEITVDADRLMEDYGWHLVTVEDDPRPVVRYRWPLGGWSESPADDEPGISDTLIRVISDRLIEHTNCGHCDWPDPYLDLPD